MLELRYGCTREISLKNEFRCAKQDCAKRRRPGQLTTACFRLSNARGCDILNANIGEPIEGIGSPHLKIPQGCQLGIYEGRLYCRMAPAECKKGVNLGKLTKECLILELEREWTKSRRLRYMMRKLAPQVRTKRRPWRTGKSVVEKDYGSPEHAYLLRKGLHMLIEQGYRISKVPKGIDSVYAVSDGCAIKDDKFYFVEALCDSSYGIEDHQILRDKLKLNNYHPVIFIVRKNSKFSQRLRELGHPYVVEVD